MAADTRVALNDVKFVKNPVDVAFVLCNKHKEIYQSELTAIIRTSALYYNIVPKYVSMYVI